MRLKRLEIYGFKSFADRTVVVFDEGITGIVGPNGSGKSNLSDAVRWVLGEQSAKALRGGKMEDVIFNGTQKRKRMGYCEVSLVFENEDHALSVDYTEVMITRRVYRSGEGEYYINKSACRLKDIVELFRDTGVGKEGYSIIGQGRIDEILSQKSEDRRGVFEEAAGIVKYRTRKEESEKRLSNMRDNLSRVEVFRDDGSAEQIFHDAAVLLVKLDQLAGHAHAARHGQHLPLLRAERPAADGRHRQEGRAPQLVLAQIRDHVSGDVFVRRDDVLQRAAEHGFHRAFKLFGHAHQRRDNAAHALISSRM